MNIKSLTRHLKKYFSNEEYRDAFRKVYPEIASDFDTVAYQVFLYEISRNKILFKEDGRVMYPVLKDGRIYNIVIRIEDGEKEKV